MRILIASDYYPPFIGGAHRQTRLLAVELANRGHTVAVATLWHPGAEATECDDGFPVFRLRQLRSVASRFVGNGQQHAPPFPDPVTAWQFRKLIRKFAPDVVHAYGGITFSACVALVGSSTPLVLAARDYGLNCPIRTLVRNDDICSGPGIDRCPTCAIRYYGVAKGLVAVGGLGVSRPLAARTSAALHSVSTYVEGTVLRDVLKGRTIPVVVVPSFQEDEPVVATPVESRILRELDALGEPFMLFVGALRREKGIEELLAAYGQLLSPIPLVLIGTVERDTPTEMPDNVIVHQNATLPEVLGAWDRAAFGVLPSRWPEPLGSVVYEAMSRGRAVIGTRPGGHEDIVDDGVNGLLVPAGDLDALLQAMNRLCRDVELRERLGEAARAGATRFVARQSVPRIESFLSGVVESRKMAGRVSPRIPFSA